MRGTRLLRIVAPWMRAETVERVVAPAVADLQFEEEWASIACNYLGVLRAVQGALWWEVQRSATHLYQSDSFRSGLAAATVPIAYLAALTIFFSDLSAGAYELRHSAVLTNPTLRHEFMTGIGVLAIVATGWIGGRLSQWGCSRSGSRDLYLVLAMVLCASTVGAQTTESQTRVVAVDGKAMRVRVSGLEQRQPNQPLIILEAGAVDPGKFHLDEWSKVFGQIAAIAPVMAYERRGNGMSEDDSEPPTMRRVAHVLHALLRQLNSPPPYVLVGHSWGGNYIRAFTDEYPLEVVGLVFIDAETGSGPTREEKAAVLPRERRADALKPPLMPPMPPNLRPGHRAEFDEIAKEMISDGAEARTFKAVTSIPIAMIVATPPNRLRGDGGPIVRLMIQKDLEMVLASPNGMLVTADHVGHAVQNDDPALVTNIIKHVLDHVVTRGR